MPKSLLPQDVGNPKGYWEDRCLVYINERLLNAFGGEWARPPQWAEPTRAAGVVQELSVMARAYLTRVYRDSWLWAQKDPRMCFTTGFWEKVWRKVGVYPRYVLCVRRPIAVAQSLAARDGLARSHALRLWCRYCSAALRSLRKPCVIVDYDQFLSDPTAEMVRIGRTLGLTAEMDDVRAVCDAHVEMALRHWVDVDSEESSLSSLADRMYAACRRLAVGVEPPAVHELRALARMADLVTGEIGSSTE